MVGRRARCKNCHWDGSGGGRRRPQASQHTGALPGFTPPAAPRGVDVWHRLCVRLCGPPRSTPRRLLTFRAGAAPEVRLTRVARRVRPSSAARLRSNYGPSAVQPYANFAGHGTVWSGRGGRNRANFDLPHPNRRSNQAQTRPKHAQTLMQFEESGQTLLSVRPPSCV